MKASELAALVGGTLHGEDVDFGGVAPLETAGPGHCAYAEDAVPEGCRAGVLLARAAAGRSTVVVDDPKLAFIRLLVRLFPVEQPAGVQPGAFIHPTARLAEGVIVYPGVYVGPDCSVGARTVLHPGVVLYADTVVGADCILHAGCVLGADGFSYHPGPEGPVKVPQVGRVRVEDNVEIGANACIDRAFLTETVIGRDSKLDNLVQVGHNSRLGRGVLVAGQAGLSGSVTVGDGSVLAGQAGVADHVTLGPGTVVGAQSGVHNDLDGGTWLGTPAMPVKLARRVFALWRRLPEMWAALRQ